MHREEGPSTDEVGHPHADRLAEDYKHERADQENDDRERHEDREPVHLPERSIFLDLVHDVHSLHYRAKRPRNPPEREQDRDDRPESEGALSLTLSDAEKLPLDKPRGRLRRYPGELVDHDVVFIHLLVTAAFISTEPRPGNRSGQTTQQRQQG